MRGTNPYLRSQQLEDKTPLIIPHVIAIKEEWKPV
jgi:hypothetical protein